MNSPEPRPATAFEGLPRLPKDAEGPVFAEPWQAQAFALAVRLHVAGVFTWPEWAAALTTTLRAAEARGEPDDGSRYYEHWLTTLEGLAVERRIVLSEALAERKQAWTEAYLHTPHGQPVSL